MRFLDKFKQPKIKDAATVKNSKAFCILPWVHLYVSPHGLVNPCCLTPWKEEDAFGKIDEQPFADIWNGEKIRDFRKNMLADKKVSSCWQCYENETLGLRSKRQISNENYAHKLPWILATEKSGYSKDAKPVYWDLRISNLCNFKCRICSHDSSSKLYDEAKLLGTTIYPTRVNYSIKDIDTLLE